MRGANAGAAGIGAMHAVSRDSMDCRINMMLTLTCAVNLIPACTSALSCCCVWSYSEGIYAATSDTVTVSLSHIVQPTIALHVLHAMPICLTRSTVYWLMAAAEQAPN